MPWNTSKKPGALKACPNHKAWGTKNVDTGKFVPGYYCEKSFAKRRTTAMNLNYARSHGLQVPTFKVKKPRKSLKRKPSKMKMAKK